MLKARATTTDNRVLLVIGISPEELNALIDDEPIFLDVALDPPHGLDWPDGPRVVIYAGDDHDELVATIEAMTEPEQ